MRASCFRTDPPSLVAALTAVEMLSRYQEALIAELPSLADRALIRHLKRMSTLASRVQVEGFEQVARHDLGGSDELLSDVFAVATYQGWELPLAALGEREIDVAGLQRGLLGADQAADSARVWLLDGVTVALARAREAGAEVELGQHPRAAPPDADHQRG